MNVEVKVSWLGTFGACTVTVADLERREAHTLLFAPGRARVDGMPCMNPMDPAPLPPGPPLWALDKDGCWTIQALGGVPGQRAYVGGGA